MVNDQILNYIRQQLAAGKAKDEIKKLLTTQGWNEQDVNEAFVVVEGGTNTVQPAALVTPTSGIKNNIGKFFVLVVYVLLVFSAPLVYQIPFVQNQIGQFIGQFTQSLVPHDTDQFFRQYITLLKNGNIEQAYLMMSKEARQQIATSSVQQLTPYFANTTDQMEVVGAQIHKYSSSDVNRTHYGITYEAVNNDTAHPYTLVSIAAEDTGSGIQILGVNVREETQSIKEQSKFNFSTQGIYFILALLIPFFIVYTAYRYLTKAKNPHWVMFLVILFLSVYVSITSNEFNLHVGVYGFISKSGLYAPWIFMTPIPLGAIYYYFVRKKYE